MEPPYAPWSDRPLVLEIGFGMGEATALMAANSPDIDLLAVDVHPAGIMALLRRVEAAGLPNVRVVEGDAVAVLAALPDACLAELRVFFPDPWPKARHAKRRLLRPSFAALAAAKLAPGAALHLATDWPAYVEHALLALHDWDARVIDRPESRPTTAYERRALQVGRQATDLLCTPLSRCS